MRNLLLLFVTVLEFCTVGYAQLETKPRTPYSLFPKKQKPYEPSIKPPVWQQPQKNVTIAPRVKIQNLGVGILNNPLTYSHNNKRGFDVYKSDIDGMPVAMPDKENTASLGMTPKKTSELPEVYLDYKGPQFLEK
ncbi:MAG: hypothetical protein DI598_04405 [Pseudopedobacter saltans]|uniref:Uncharacterized protein n=1 Tax=Pseudopedobacter saltans TaxID=151895 RepID=A0A2W5HB31_9SPHI|nr:MAG: hypothetical protein DI598_04405 [Pseudopedobacter saltans]